MAPKPRWKPMAGRESGRLEMFAPNLERRGQLEQLEIFETEIHGRDTHLAQRISMRRNGLRQSRVNAFDTMVAVRGSGSLEVEKSKAKVRDHDV